MWCRGAANWWLNVDMQAWLKTKTPSVAFQDHWRTSGNRTPDHWLDTDPWSTDLWDTVHGGVKPTAHQLKLKCIYTMYFTLTKLKILQIAYHRNILDSESVKLNQQHLRHKVNFHNFFFNIPFLKKKHKKTWLLWDTYNGRKSILFEKLNIEILTFNIIAKRH